MRLGRTRTAESALAPPSDGELASLAAAGDTDAFEELYRRHVQAAWRVAQAVTGNRDDAADAVAEAFTKVLQALPKAKLADDQFRPYLMSATRNAGIDVLRRNGRLRPEDEMDDLAGAAVAPGPSDRLLDKLDSSLVAAAFRTLPERWRSVLWLTEVEGLPPREVSEHLGMSPNSASQLAVRARAGLRERYLQAHLRGDIPLADECRFTVEHLGAHVAGQLSPRDLAKVDQHLAGCAACRDRAAELEDVGRSLRRIVIPIPIALAPLALGKWKLATSNVLSVRSLVPNAETVLRVQKPLAGITMSILTAGIIMGGVLQAQSPLPPRQVTKTPQVPFNVQPSADSEAVAPAAAPAIPSRGAPIPASTFAALDDAAAADVAPAVTAPVEPIAVTTPPPLVAPPVTTTPTNQTTPPPPPPVAKPLAQITAVIPTADVVIAVGQGANSCTGVQVGAQTVGCAAAAPVESGATISTGGTAIPSQTIKAPVG